MDNKNHKSTWPTFLQLWFFLKPYKLWVSTRVVSTITKASIDVLITFLVLRLVNSAVAGNREVLVKSLCLILGFVSVELIAFFLETYSSGRLSSYVVRDIKERLSCHMAKMPVSYVENHHSGDLVSRMINNTNGIEGFLKGSFLDIVFHGIRFTCCFIYMVFLNWVLLIFCLVILTIATIVSNIISKPLGHYTEQLYKNLGKVNSIAQDSMGGIHMLKAFNLTRMSYLSIKMQ